MRARVLAALLFLGMTLSGCVGGEDEVDDPDPTASASPTPDDTGAPTNGTGDANKTDDGVVRPPSRSTAKTTFAGAWPVTTTFEPKEISVPTGSILNLTVWNSDRNTVSRHAFKLDEIDAAKTGELPPNTEMTLEFLVSIPPGEYVFYCEMPNHRNPTGVANGPSRLEGTFIVTEA